MTITTIIKVIKAVFPVEGKSIFRGIMQGIACACILEIIYHIPITEDFRIVFRKIFPLIYCICIFLILTADIKRKSFFKKDASLGWQSLGLIAIGAVFCLTKKIAGISFRAPSAFIYAGVSLLIFDFCFQLFKHKSNI